MLKKKKQLKKFWIKFIKQNNKNHNKMNTAIIVGAGYGKRMGADKNKILLHLDDKPIIHYTIKVFQDCDFIDRIIIVTKTIPL